jgi:hypothetical protein
MQPSHFKHGLLTGRSQCTPAMAQTLKIYIKLLGFTSTAHMWGPIRCDIAFWIGSRTETPSSYHRNLSYNSGRKLYLCWESLQRYRTRSKSGMYHFHTWTTDISHFWSFILIFQLLFEKQWHQAQKLKLLNSVLDIPRSCIKFTILSLDIINFLGEIYKYLLNIDALWFTWGYVFKNPSWLENVSQKCI